MSRALAPSAMRRPSSGRRLARALAAIPQVPTALNVKAMSPDTRNKSPTERWLASNTASSSESGRAL